MAGQKAAVIFLMAMLLVASLLSGVPARAEVKLPAIFGDNMVLQQGIKVPVWGWAKPGDTVKVSIAEQKAQATAGKDGRWRLTLEPLKPGPVLEMTVASGGKSVTLRNILVGEVWLGSGQSNMGMAVSGSINHDAEIAAANYPEIRLFTVVMNPTETPQADCQGSWVVCTPKTVADFSATAYFFGRDLYKDLRVPVGLIHTSYGATSIGAWMSLESLQSDPAFKPVIAGWERAKEDHRKLVAEYETTLATWKAQAAKTKAGQPLPPEPKKPVYLPQYLPLGPYNGTIAPLIPFGLRGVIWYQGESNAGEGVVYRKLLATMIQSWRKDWGLGDFPFLIVQIANYGERKPEPVESGWALVRQAQLETLSLPKTGLAVTIDIGSAASLHPLDKPEVGRRLALIAEATVYGKKGVVYSGPLCEAMKVEGSTVRLKFSHAEGGLAVKDVPALKGFALAGADGKFFWAEAKIEGDTVALRSGKVPAPLRVRYAWADNPECNLYNKAGLPASPFEMPSSLDAPGKATNSKGR
jgi:sialate O-acetylesterase